MNHQEQVETVKKALDLSVLVADTNNNLSKLSSQKFCQAPTRPTRTIVKKAEVPIQPQTKVNWILALVPCLIFSLLWCIVYYFIYKYQCKTEIERIQNSDEYKKQCIAAEEEYRRKQAEADALFKKQSEEYEAILLPKYQKDLEEWNAQHNKQIADMRGRLQQAQDSLQELYETTKIVPIQYRNVKALQYIYDVLSTSNYDIVQAINNYDKKVQRDLEQARLIQQKTANDLAAQRAKREAQQQYYNSSEHGFFSDVASAAIGTSIGTHGIKKEMKKQTQFMEEQARRNERNARENRRKEAKASQARRAAVIRENQERRRKGLPPLPVPPADWY